MPATRRSRTSGGPAANGAQRTLSFGTKVTKPTSISGKDKSSSTAPPTTVDVGHVTSEAAVTQQAEIELHKTVKTEEEERASKVTDAQIRKYWRAKEAERKAPRGEVSCTSQDYIGPRQGANI